MTQRFSLLSRLRLRHAVLIALLFSGIIPLLISNLLLISKNRTLLEGQERDQLVNATRVLSRELNDDLGVVEKQLAQLGASLLVLGQGAGSSAATAGDPLPADFGLSVLRRTWVGPYFERVMGATPNLLALRVLAPGGEGPLISRRELGPEALSALDSAFDGAIGGHVQYRFTAWPGSGEPLAALAVPVGDGGAEPQLVIEGLWSLSLLDSVFRREARGEVEVLLIDAGGEVLFSEGSDAERERALAESALVRDFVGLPLNLTTEYTVIEDGQSEQVLARVSPVERSGWGVVVQKPADTAFEAVDEMVFNAAMSFVLLVVLALLFALLAARRVSEPIQKLADTSHEIASGNFGRRVETSHLLHELAHLGNNFNRMSRHVESYTQQLQRAAQTNRDLFIGSLRAFAAAIDAKDPYTRGHSERVASLSRTLARNLDLSSDLQERVWIAALLHDVGKIGVDDQVLKKVGALEPEEFEMVKTHTTIGADILSPIEQLKEMVPAVRWHHENWDGGGYPDGLVGDQIPMIARIVAIADTFDAVTTNRPYQQAYSLEAAVEMIKKLTGARFDSTVTDAFLRAYDRGEIQPAASEPSDRVDRRKTQRASRVFTMT